MNNIGKYIHYHIGGHYVIGLIAVDYGHYFKYDALETNSVTWVVGNRYFGFLDKVIIADSFEQLNKMIIFQ